MNLMMLLEMASSGFGDRTAFQNGSESFTYQELFNAAGAAANAISESGCERVALLDVNSLAIPLGVFGSAWAGIPFSPLNYRLTGPELEALAGRIAPSYFVTDTERMGALEGLPGAQLVSRDDFLSQARAGAARESDWSMDGDEIAILLFTSGTTGAPKAAVIRQKHLVSYVLGSVEFMGAAEEDAALVCVPPYHIAGMAAIASSVYSGRRVVQLSSFTPETWIETVRKENITNAFVVPTMLVRIIETLESQGSADFPSLRAISYGGGKMPLPVIQKAMDFFPETSFTNAYGLTETSSTIAILGPDDHRESAASDDPEVQRRLTSVGVPLPTLEVMIRDEDGNVLEPGERGEICVRGEQVSGEYLEKGSLLDEEGWFPTRDGGFIDSGGYLFIDGRVDDVIVRGGENMSPGEIEDVLLDHSGVRDCAVVGMPDEQWGETVVAVVVLHEAHETSEEAIQEWVRDRLRSSRTPSRVGFWSELPYNETGKLLRRTVKERLADE
ncbi:MAG: class I adenylate-forming enzyme family protein [Myxococcota bacterium]|nr:class I adenylate-forming enzyme family protein [Myxococcota bacterium]